MKMTKKFFAAALAVAALSLVGCNMNEDEYGILDFDAPNGVCTIDYTNENEATVSGNTVSGTFIRGWATFNTNHVTSNCLITMEGLDTVVSDVTQKGNMGFMFNLTKNDDKTYNFNVITLKYGGSGKLMYYISNYVNVDANYLSGPAQNFCDLDGKPAGTNSACKEVQIAPTSGTWATVTGWTVTDNKLNAFIKLDYSDTDGYTINVYDGTDASGVSKITEANIKNGLVADEDDTTKFEKPENMIGCYAMVKPSQTLKGSWKFTNIQGNAIPLELAD